MTSKTEMLRFIPSDEDVLFIDPYQLSEATLVGVVLELRARLSETKEELQRERMNREDD